MAIQCDYTTPSGIVITSAYCKIVTLGLNEYSENTGTRNAFITIGIWPSAESRNTNIKPDYIRQVLVINGYVANSADPLSNDEYVADYDRVFGADVLSGDGQNPVLAAYNEIKGMPEFSTNQVDV
jgi:hypothetical protein